MKIKLGELLFEQRKTIGKPDGNNLDLMGVSNKIGLHLSKARRIADLSRYKLIQKDWFAYNPMRINVGSVGYVINKEHIGIVSPDYVVFSCSEKITPEYLLYLLKSDEGKEAIGKNASGAVRKRLYFSNLANIEIVLPTIDIQKRRLISFKKTQQLLGKIKSQTSKESCLSQLKQAILQEAIQGKLTAGWRKQNPDTEPASELLKHIKAEKQKLVDEKKIRKEKPLPPISEEEIPFALPDGWGWCRLGKICSKTGSGSTPRGGKTAYTNRGIPFIRSQNVYDDGLRLNDIVCIPELIHKRMNGTIVYRKDLLLNITGGSIGRCCIVDNKIIEANINQHVAIVRTVFSGLGYFAHNIICSPYFQQEIVNAQTGAGREGLPKNKMDRILIPLPPLQEQKAIVKIVESLMQKCTTLETEIKQSEIHAEQLMQAVIKKAFEPSETREVN